MEFANPFAAPGQWFRGNLHAHTGRSDGIIEPEEVVKRYRLAGYDFLSITDHGAVTEVDPGGDDFLLLLGTEMDGDRSELGETFHVVGFGLAEAAPVPRGPTVPEALAWAREHGGEGFIAHPAWSGLSINDLLRYQDHLGIEVFNTGCHFEIAKGYSTAHWDDLLGRGARASGFAVDDAHNRPSDRHPLDTARAWIMVKAAELSREALMKAIREGLFYSSWGPTIHEIAVQDGQVTARTSPAKEINFIAQRWCGGSVFAMDTPTISEATYRLSGDEQYLRVECRDAEGRWAWSNPIYF